MTFSSRRTFLRSLLVTGGALGAATALGACTTTTSNGTTTYAVDVTKILSLISSVESGLTQIASSSTVTSVLGATDSAKLTSAITTVSQVTAQIAANAASSVSVTVAKDWVTTAESAAGAALTVLESLQSLLPANVNVMVQAVAALLPALAALIGAVSTSSTSLSAPEAQAIIARGLSAN
ncbi:hypothetical protein [Acetobacter estunensis]|uniref:hypothetical protein n=1 Tax=Acetobacter estunensis TaxID=104097 RepID=UPI001C2D51EF|nr:hypothetical protein [Acetobacter estunensis]MBV1837813.1 hypothetical protein [Acetobacter estunensis]